MFEFSWSIHSVFVFSASGLKSCARPSFTYLLWILTLLRKTSLIRHSCPLMYISTDVIDTARVLLIEYRQPPHRQGASEKIYLRDSFSICSVLPACKQNSVDLSTLSALNSYPLFCFSQNFGTCLLAQPSSVQKFQNWFQETLRLLVTKGRRTVEKTNQKWL